MIKKVTASLISFFFLIGLSAQAGEKEFSHDIEKLEWKGIEVVWLRDQRYPTYDVSIYFADGALSDQTEFAGETEMMFQQLPGGTSKYNQQQISDALEFYGTSLSTTVFHEYSILGFSGLVKDIQATTKMICHLFRQSLYPDEEVIKHKERLRSSLQNLVTNPSALTDRVFRSLTMKGTVYATPTEGHLNSIGQISGSRLRDKLKFFNDQVKKRIYIVGPPEALSIKDLLINDCQWDGSKATYVREKQKNKLPETKNNHEKGNKSTQYYFIPVHDANQTQIRVGRYLTPQLIGKPDLMTVMSSYLGGGFTSMLMQELRVKRGLTYSVGAVASAQRDYGRVVVTTFTKSETTNEAIQVIQQTLKKLSQGQFPQKSLKKSVDYLSGRYLFTLEKNSALLGNLLFYDHLGRQYKEFYEFPEKIKKFTKKDLVDESARIFNWNDQIIVVLGDQKLIERLKKLGQVKVLPYEMFL